MAAKQSTVRTSLTDTSGLGARLREARELSRATLQDAATSLRWSIGRLRSYETDATQPTVAELVVLARQYSVDAAQLAFGDSAGKALAPAGESVRWVGRADGATMAVPARLVDGVPGPLVYVDIDHPLPCTAIYQRGAFPPESGGYAVIQVEAGATLGWVWRLQHRWWMQSSPSMPKQLLKTDHVLGRLVVHLTRVV